MCSRDAAGFRVPESCSFRSCQQDSPGSTLAPATPPAWSTPTQPGWTTAPAETGADVFSWHGGRCPRQSRTVANVVVSAPAYVHHCWSMPASVSTLSVRRRAQRSPTTPDSAQNHATAGSSEQDLLCGSLGGSTCHAGHQTSRIHAQHGGEGEDVEQADVAFTALDRAHVRPVQACPVR